MKAYLKEHKKDRVTDLDLEDFGRLWDDSVVGERRPTEAMHFNDKLIVAYIKLLVTSVEFGDVYVFDTHWYESLLDRRAKQQCYPEVFR
jgi:hypothetical protein